MTVPEGFKVTLFAGEPDVSPADRLRHRRPRAGSGLPRRIPIRSGFQPEGKARDRIVIFEDKDNDGKFRLGGRSSPTSLNLVSGLELGDSAASMSARPPTSSSSPT